MSKTVYREISQEQMLARATLVFVVRRTSPPERQTEMPITTTASYIRVQHRYIVEEVVRGPSAWRNKTIEVDGAFWEQELARRKAFYLQGLDKAPVYERYDAPDVSNRYIVFLRERPHGLAFVCDDAVDTVACLKELRVRDL